MAKPRALYFRITCVHAGAELAFESFKAPLYKAAPARPDPTSRAK